MHSTTLAGLAFIALLSLAVSRDIPMEPHNDIAQQLEAYLDHYMRLHKQWMCSKSSSASSLGLHRAKRSVLTTVRQFLGCASAAVGGDTMTLVDTLQHQQRSSYNLDKMRDMQRRHGLISDDEEDEEEEQLFDDTSNTTPTTVAASTSSPFTSEPLDNVDSPPSLTKLQKYLMSMNVTRDDPCTSETTQNLTEAWRNLDRIENCSSGVTVSTPTTTTIDASESDGLVHPYGYYYPRDDFPTPHCDKDLQAGTTWFRFSAEAGDVLADRCPTRGCGGDGAFWSDSPMPTVVGQILMVEVHGSYQKNCYRYRWMERRSMLVKRCSDDPADLVYLVHGTQSCYWTFCGINIK